MFKCIKNALTKLEPSANVINSHKLRLISHIMVDVFKCTSFDIITKTILNVTLLNQAPNNFGWMFVIKTTIRGVAFFLLGLATTALLGLKTDAICVASCKTNLL
jgi:hypothetical protein